MTALAARRRHPMALVLLIALALLATGAAYAALAPKPAQASTASSDDIAEGKKLFLANCATCHGLNAQGGPVNLDDQTTAPSLIGVGAASVDFQVGTGRMPMAQPGPQAPGEEGPVQPGGDQPARRVRRVAGPRPGDPGCGVHQR